VIPALASDLELYAAPQRRFDELRERTSKQFGARTCDLAYANPYDGPATAALDAIRGALASDRGLDLQYTPYGGATITRRLVARRLGTYRGEPVTWKHVVMTPGAMSALNVVFRAVRRDDQENEIVVVTPCWLDYPLYLAHLGIRPRFVPVQPTTLRLDLDGLARALSPHTRAVVLSQPANPSGLLYGDEELGALARILRESAAEPLLISDECHRDVVFGRARFVSPAEHYDATCIVHSFGKSWFMQGQRIGYAAVSPNMPEALAFADRLVAFCRIMGHATPTALMQLAVRDLVGRKPAFDAIARRKERAAHALQRVGYRLADSCATYFLYPEVPGGGDDVAFCDALASRGVLVLPSALFHHRGHFRLSLTADDAQTERALEILEDAFQGSAAA
jgi:aspartate aminotransferase